MGESNSLQDGAEYDRRWLRVEALQKESQALRYIEAVTGSAIPPDMTFHEALKSGERLCDLANVFLRAAGQSALTPTRTADGASAEAPRWIPTRDSMHVVFSPPSAAAPRAL